jgi:hypothetical protein
MTGDQVTTVVTAITTALAGLGGTALGGWITRRSTITARHLEEVDRARAALLRLASLLINGPSEGKNIGQIAEDAAAGAMALGYGSSAALTIIETMESWRRFQSDSFPDQRARNELLPLIDRMLERSLPSDLRTKDPATVTDLKIAVRRPDLPSDGGANPAGALGTGDKKA